MERWPNGAARKAHSCYGCAECPQTICPVGSWSGAPAGPQERAHRYWVSSVRPMLRKPGRPPCLCSVAQRVVKHVPDEGHALGHPQRALADPLLPGVAQGTDLRGVVGWVGGRCLVGNASTQQDPQTQHTAALRAAGVGADSAPCRATHPFVAEPVALVVVSPGEDDGAVVNLRPGGQQARCG